MTTRHLRHDDDAPEATRLRWLLSLCAILFMACLLLYWPGCRQYPEATSAESMKLMKLLYAACNTRDAVRLRRAEQRLEQVIRAGKMTEREQESFRKILNLARDGEWEQAEKASFRFAQDQVR